MTYQQPRTLPLRIPLHDGESLDSWLYRLAHRNGMPLIEFSRVLGFGDRLRYWRNHALSWRLPTDLMRRIEFQTGLPPGRLDLTVLDQFDPLGWTPTVGSRYCTRCLADNDGRWSIRWQLPYTFACLTHRCLLATTCPSCHRPPRHGISKESGLLNPNLCTLRTPGDVCRRDALAHRPRYLRPRDTRLSAQLWVNERLDRLDDDAVTELRDLDALANWLLARVLPSDLTRLGPSTILAMTEHREHHKRSAKKPLPTWATVTAALACHAIWLIDAQDARRRVALLGPLLRDVHTEYSRPGKTPTRYPGPMILSRSRLATLSEPLRNNVLIAADPRLSVSERLRYRTCTPAPRLPEPAVAAERARHIPQYLWQDWIVRFCPTGRRRADELATGIPAALLIPGNPLRNKHATVELNPWRTNLSNLLSIMSRQYPDVLRAICAIAEHLDTHGSPVDYRRRRATFTDATLTDQQWRHVCDRADADPGTSRRLLHARRHTFQLLTGADLTDQRHRLAFTTPWERTHYQLFQREMSSALRAELHQHAQGVLANNSIDEPVTWSPPAECATGLRLPGRDPNDIDLDALRQLALVDNLATVVAARRLGVSTEHVRHALQRLHQPPRKRRTAMTAAAREKRSRADRTLTAEFFQREHIVGGKNLTTLMAETGFSRKMLHEFADRTGTELVTRGRRAQVDQDWLYIQAGTLGRTNDDIGAELGLAGETIRRHRMNKGIPGRPTGGHGHVVTYLRHPDLPRDIRRAVEGQRNGWLRLRRLQHMLAYPSINAAAHALGIHSSNLNLQIKRLETDIGGALLQRTSHRYAPMKLTSRGRRLMAHLEQPAIRDLLNRYADANTKALS